MHKKEFWIILKIAFWPKLPKIRVLLLYTKGECRPSRRLAKHVFCFDFNIFDCCIEHIYLLRKFVPTPGTYCLFRVARNASFSEIQTPSQKIKEFNLVLYCKIKIQKKFFLWIVLYCNLLFFSEDRLILEDLDSAYRVLVPEMESLCGKIESNEQRTYTLVQAESIIIFHLKALTDIG